MVFSSSASIYATAPDGTVDENSPLDPQSPYARTKAHCEQMFADIAATGDIRVLSLRYFNPIGADPKMRTGLQLPLPSHALDMMIRAGENGTPFPVTGTDWPTGDGTGIRDYVHVQDLAEAHVAALPRFAAALPANAGGSLAINLGTGAGTTVREPAAVFNAVAENPIILVDSDARPGDVAGAYTRGDRAARLLGRRPRYSVADGIADSLRWAAIRDRVLTS